MSWSRFRGQDTLFANAVAFAAWFDDPCGQQQQAEQTLLARLILFEHAIWQKPLPYLPPIRH